ncbi:hypothetical protein MKW92_009715, partial [Papaver armeniacum]
MAITAAGRKRGRKPLDSTQPEQKRTKIKDEEAEPSGSGGDPMDLDSKTSKSVADDAKKISKGKGKAVESDFPEIKSTTTRKGKGKARSSVKRPRKRSVAPLKKKKFVNEEDDDEVADLEIINPEKAVDEEENQIEDGVVEKFERKVKSKNVNGNSASRLTGAVPVEEARIRWPDRYDPVKIREGGANFLQVRRHYTSAVVDGETYNLNDCCFIKAEKGQLDYVGRIVEFFETVKKQPYISVKWFFRAEDTVIKEHSHKIEPKRIFSSDSRDDNPLDCIVQKVTVVQASTNVPKCDFYYDMSYSEEFCTFENLRIGNQQDAAASSSSSIIYSEGSSKAVDVTTADPNQPSSSGESEKVMTLLDLYAGCGGMSTGLCIGAAASDVNLVTRWAVDFSKYACESLQFNHPETEVRNMKAEDFLQLLKEWHRLCGEYDLLGSDFFKTGAPTENEENEETEEEAQMRPPDENGEFEVQKVIGIHYGANPDTDEGPAALHYKVKWKGWGSDWDSWEPATNLKNCKDCIEDFVTRGYKSHILPLPGTVDVVCGGPPCQGISGFNRFRNYKEPLKDEKNFQLVVFRKIIKFLQPRFTLMENVVDIMRFLNGTLGRYAIARLVAMHYQVRLGFLVAGNFGLPQYRMRAFLWGAKTTEILPQFPVPTHKVIGRGHAPKAFERNLVKGDEANMLKELLLGDAISDMPHVTTHETADEMDYGKNVPTIWISRGTYAYQSMLMVSAHASSDSVTHKLYDHRPLKLSEDDNLRVSKIPRRKGANYRNLPGVIVDPKTNKASRNRKMKKVIIPKSGKPLVPEYALKYVKGTSR